MTVDPAARHRSRELAVQWLYQWELSGLDVEDVLSRERQVELHPPDDERDGWAAALVRGTAHEIARIDPVIAAAATNWRIERMAIVERNVIRIALFELKYCPDVPFNVVLNEAVELAKRYGTAEGAAFANGMLDRAVGELGIRR